MIRYNEISLNAFHTFPARVPFRPIIEHVLNGRIWGIEEQIEEVGASLPSVGVGGGDAEGGP